jgi:antitoxin component YwqK of YwqJK toxin-antitoxin module
MKRAVPFLIFILLLGNSCVQKSPEQKKLQTGIYLCVEKPGPNTITIIPADSSKGKFNLDTNALLIEEDFQNIDLENPMDTLSIQFTTKGGALFKSKEYSMDGKKIAVVINGMLVGAMTFSFEKNGDDSYSWFVFLMKNRMQMMELSDSLNKKWKGRIIPDDKIIRNGVVKEYYRNGKLYSEIECKDSVPLLHRRYYESGMLESEWSDPSDTLGLLGPEFLRDYYPNGKLKTDSKNFFADPDVFGPAYMKNYDINGQLTDQINACMSGKNQYYVTRDYDDKGNLEFHDSTFYLPLLPGQNENETPSVTYTEHYRKGKPFYKEHDYDRGKLDPIPCDLVYQYTGTEDASYRYDIPTWQQLYKHDCDSARATMLKHPEENSPR